MKKIITILSIAFAFTTSKAQLSQGLIAHYPFNNSLNDISTNANNGTITVGDYRYTKDKNGNNNQALEFIRIGSGVVGYMDANITNGSSQFFSMSFWFNPSDSGLGTAKVINGGKTASGDPIWSLEQFPHNDTSVRLQAYAYADKNFTNYASDVVYCKKAWNFVTIIFAASDSLHIYLNGKKTTSSKVNFGTLTGVPTIMRFGHALPNYVCPYNPIDEFRLYNRRLLETEIQELYTVSSLSIKNFPVKYHFTTNPNPTVNSIEIKGINLENKFASIVSNDGRVTKVIIENNTIDVSNLNSGIYNLIIKSETGEIEAIEKFIKN